MNKPIDSDNDSGSGELNAEKTQIKPRIQPSSASTDQAKFVPSAEHPAQRLSPQMEDQLTRIGKAMRELDTSRGFEQAKLASDKALATNKIILNNRFVLEATLGAGGMGTVYRAKDLRKVEARDPNPFVAVKVLNDEFKHHPDAFITLQREASRSHILSHPNIVTVHDFDRDGDVIFMTMELLRGQGLEAITRRHKGKGLTTATALKIIRDIGLALAYAHQKHIVHSDLKPGNIFVTKDGAKVLDFGIARLTNQATANVDFDAGSLGALTPTYASLEMLQGEPPHPSDDVYAAAIIAYELFTGNHPYQRKSADVALREKLRPAPIKTLSKQQWRTLEQGLKLRREDRLQDITRFYKGLTQKSRSIKGLLFGTVVISVIAAIISYRLLAGNQLEKRIQQTYHQGEFCLQQGDLSCATDSAKAVLQLDPDHGKSIVLLSRATEQYTERRRSELLDTFNRCLAENDVNCATQIVTELGKLLGSQSSELLKLNQSLSQFKQEQQRQAFLKIGQQCFDQKDFACAISNATAALADGESSAATALLNQAQDAQRLEQQTQRLTSQKYQSAMATAQQCVAQKDYNCALQHTEIAAQTQVNTSAVQALKQTIQFAQESQTKNLEKAHNLLAKGQKCFTQKNYSCAIANAESALEFVANFTPALQLRATAQQEVKRLKQQIIIE